MGNAQSSDGLFGLIFGIFGFSKYTERWRDVSWHDSDEMLQRIKGFSSRLSNVPYVNLLLVGAVGSGKTSFFNTIDSAFKGRTAGREEAATALSGSASITKKFRILKPGCRRERDLAFRLCDTMGMEESDGLNLDDLEYIIDGNVPHDYVFKSNSRISTKSRGYIRNPKFEQKMHCIAYVLDITKISMAERDIGSKFERLRSIASSRDVKIILLVTHIDEMSSVVSEDIMDAYRCGLMKREVDKISQVTGVPESRIYLIKNYSHEGTTDHRVDALNLTALETMLDYAKDFVS